MSELVWPVVALIVALLAWHRMAPLRPVNREVQVMLAKWPEPDVFLGKLDEVEQKLKAFESSGTTLPAIVARANELTKDMLAMKTVLAEVREQVTLMRTKNALRAVGGAQE